MGARAVIGAALVALALAGGLGCPTGPRAPSSPPSLVLPVLPVIDRTGAPKALAELAAGRPMVIDFFASWCKPCAPQVQKVEELARAEVPNGLFVVGVAVGESWSEAGPFLDDLGATYPAFVDPDFHFADAVGARNVPAIYVVDRAGNIVHRAAELDAAARAAIARVLAP